MGSSLEKEVVGPVEEALPLVPTAQDRRFQRLLAPLISPRQCAPIGVEHGTWKLFQGPAS